MEDEERLTLSLSFSLTFSLMLVRIRGVQKFYRAHSSHLWARRERVLGVKGQKLRSCG